MAKRNSTPNDPAIVSAFKVFVESHNTESVLLLGKLAAAGVNISNQIAVFEGSPRSMRHHV